MKRALNIYAEVLALPYSELFMDTDPIREGAVRSRICDKTKTQSDRIYTLEKELGQAFLYAADYLNRYTEIYSLTELQSYMRHVFSAKDILDCLKNQNFTDERDVIRRYYIWLLEQHAHTLLTTRNGVAMLRPWDALPDTLFRPRDDRRPAADTSKLTAFLPQRVELWNSILRCTPEDLLISCYAANRTDMTCSPARQRSISFDILKSFGDTIHIADALLDQVLDKGMAETHMHAGASRSFGLIWEDMLRNSLLEKPIAEKDRYKLPFKGTVTAENLRQLSREAAVTRLLLASYLQGNCDRMDEYLVSERISPQTRIGIYRAVRDIHVMDHPLGSLSAVVTPGVVFIADVPRYAALDIWSILRLPPELRNSCPSLAERCFLCWSILHIKKLPDDVLFTSLFLYYLRLRSKAYRHRVEDSKCKGLSYFQKYYSFSTDAGGLTKAEQMQEIFYTALQDRRVLKTEFRLSPPQASAPMLHEAISKEERKLEKIVENFIRQHIYTLILIYGTDAAAGNELSSVFNIRWRHAHQNIRDGKDNVLSALLKQYGIEAHSIHPHRFGIIFHLIKAGEEKEKRACFALPKAASDRQEYEKFSFGTARFSYETSVTAISNLRDRCPAMSRLIVGLDAASLEIPTEPWVFAPAFREARKRNAMLSHKGKASEQKSLLGITYHVGEDFRHPLSGLRHIDEAIGYLRMHPGDRIGHGLTLGIDTDLWYRANRMVVLPQIEWMENNLWLWNLISNTAALSDLAGYLNAIERQILGCAGAIYGKLDGITVEKLYRAYVSKTLPVHELQKRVQAIGQDLCRGVDCFREMDEAAFFPCWNQKDSLWSEDALSLSYHCGFYKQKMDRPILYSPTDEEIRLTKRLQVYMREKVADFGLIVESNPSSNATIGSFGGILLHPLYELREGEGGHVMTSINTDDPSVFNATVANEHAQIYYALRDHGYNAEDALKQVDTLREISMKSSFVGELKPIDVLLHDYEQIIRELSV